MYESIMDKENSPTLSHYKVNRRTGTEALPLHHPASPTRSRASRVFAATSPKRTRTSAAIASANAEAALAMAGLSDQLPSTLAAEISCIGDEVEFRLPNGMLLGRLGGALTEMFGDSASPPKAVVTPRPASSPEKLASPKKRWSDLEPLASLGTGVQSAPKLLGTRRRLNFDTEVPPRAVFGRPGLAECRTAVRLGRVADGRGQMVARARPELSELPKLPKRVLTP